MVSMGIAWIQRDRFVECVLRTGRIPIVGQAHKAVAGDILGVTLSLGVAFNSTFIALIISIFIMFLVHQLQLMQERLVLDTHRYCDINLIRHLKVR